jgi:hypothetical protein
MEWEQRKRQGEAQRVRWKVRDESLRKEREVRQRRRKVLERRQLMKVWVREQEMKVGME